MELSQSSGQYCQYTEKNKTRNINFIIVFLSSYAKWFRNITCMASSLLFSNPLWLLNQIFCETATTKSSFWLEKTHNIIKGYLPFFEIQVLLFYNIGLKEEMMAEMNAFEWLFMQTLLRGFVYFPFCVNFLKSQSNEKGYLVLKMYFWWGKCNVKIYAYMCIYTYKGMLFRYHKR